MTRKEADSVSTRHRFALPTKAVAAVNRHHRCQQHGRQGQLRSASRSRSAAQHPQTLNEPGHSLLFFAKRLFAYFGSTNCAWSYTELHIHSIWTRRCRSSYAAMMLDASVSQIAARERLVQPQFGLGDHAPEIGLVAHRRIEIDANGGYRVRVELHRSVAERELGREPIQCRVEEAFELVVAADLFRLLVPALHGSDRGGFGRGVVLARRNQRQPFVGRTEQGWPAPSRARSRLARSSSVMRVP